MVVYLAKNIINNKSYIGKTIKSITYRKNQHIRESKLNRNNSIFHKAIRKYGEDSFEWIILGKYKNLSELNFAEVNWITLFKEQGNILYNITCGGDGGCTNSYWKGKHIPEETKIKISNRLKKYFKTHDSPAKGKLGELSSFFGKVHTEDSKEKIKQSKLGIPRSKEVKDKLSKINLGKTHSKEIKIKLSKKFSGKNNPSARPIICVTTGEVFDYATLASNKYNIDLSSIIKCCKGKLQKTKGMEFKYYYDYPAGWQLI